MTRHQADGTGPRRSERGVAIIEMAIILPIFMLLLFGIIDFSSSMSDSNALRNGTREGSRAGVVGDVGTVTNCPITSSLSSSTDTKALVCLTKGRIGLAGANTRVKLVVPSTYTPGTTMTVCSMYPMRSLTGWFGPVLNGRYFTTKVSMRVESVDTDLASFEETPLTNGNWSWCA